MLCRQLSGWVRAESSEPFPGRECKIPEGFSTGGIQRGQAEDNSTGTIGGDSEVTQDCP
jgi:hypothetical protein